MTELEKRIAAAREKISGGEEVKTSGSELAERISQAREKLGSTAPAAAPAAAPVAAPAPAPVAAPKVTVERNLIQTRDDAGMLPGKTGSTASRLNALREDNGRVDLADRKDLLSVVPGKAMGAPVNEEAAQNARGNFGGGRTSGGGGRNVEKWTDQFKDYRFLPESWSDFTQRMGYNAERIAAGLLGGGENVTDFLGTSFYKALEGITSLGGVAPNAVSEWSGQAADKFLQNSVSRDYEESIRQRYNPNRGEEVASGVAQNVAQILLDIAAGKGLAKAASGGAALIDDAAQAAKSSAWGKAVFGTQAAGGGANEAYSEGATAGQAVKYGAATGAMEVLIESIAGGIPGLGEGKLGQVVQKVTANPVVNKALDILGEGGEEGLSAALTPYIKRAFYDKDAEAATVDEIAESVILGIVTSAVLQGLEIPGALANLGKNKAASGVEAGTTAGTMDVDPVTMLPIVGQTSDGAESIQPYQKQEHHGTVLDAVRANIGELRSMQPVKALKGTEFRKDPSDSRKLRDRVLEFFNELGNKVTRPGFGDIALNNAGVRDSLGHGYGKLKAAAFASVPEVLRDGKIVGYRGPYEGHEYDSYFIAAPVTVAGETCYVGALVIKDSKTQRYKLHEVLVENENDTPSFKTEGLDNENSIRDSVPSDSIVSQDAAKVKAESDADALEIDPVTMLPNIQKSAEDVSNSDTAEPEADPVTGLPQFKRVTPLEKSENAANMQPATEIAAETQQATPEAEKAAAENTEDLKRLWKGMKAARKNYKDVRDRIDLSKEDANLVSAMVKGLVKISDLDPGKVNAPEVAEVYRAAAEYEEYAKKLKQINAARKQQLRARAEELLATSLDWTDKMVGLLYQRETQERNFRDVIHNDELADEVIAEYITPVHDNEAAATRMRNEYRDRVRKLNLSRKVAKGNQVSEAYAVQFIGEAQDSIRKLQKKNNAKAREGGKTLADWEAEVADLWANNPNLNRAKIEGAVKTFREIYDDLFEQMNEVRLRNGYEPVDYRSGYFPHFQSDGGDNMLERIGKELGITPDVAPLPTSINGLTHRFKPGIRWFGNALHRTGFDTTYDAVEGFDRYIQGVSDIIHHTDDIQRLRALTNQIRYRSGDEGTRMQLKEIDENEALTEEQKQELRDKVYENGKFALGNFVVDLEEYTNNLANKRNQDDRNMERKLSRSGYNVMKKLQSRVAANMVAINPASWLTNFIALTQGSAGLETRYMVQGMWDTLQNVKADDGVVDQSSFLTNRKGSDPLVRTWAEGASATLGKPMEWVDQFTAGALVRGRYYQNMAAGMSEMAAMSEADSWVAGVMADRSKGALPTLFTQKNPITKLFTQFQLEVNNQYSYLFKDIPRDLKDKGVAAIAAALLKMAIGAFLYNEVYEKLVGRRPALDPIGIINDTVGDFTGYELPNLLELQSGFEPEKQKPMKALGNLAENVIGELPFTSVLGAAGLDIDGGRFPVASAIPDFTNLGGGNWRKEVVKPLTYLVPPFGGGQAKKAIEGVTAVAKGGSYKKDAEGNDKLQYPVFSDSALETAENLGKAVFFGKSSLGTAQDWVEGGFKTWDAGYTKAYQNMRDAGMGEREAYEILSAMKAADKQADKLGVLAEQDLPDKMTQELAGLVMGTELKSEEGNKTAYAKLLDAKEELGLTAAEYLAFYEKYGGQVMGEDKLRTAYEKGVDVEDYLEYYSGRKEYDTDKSGSLSAKETIKAIEGSGLTDKARVGMYLLEFPEWGEKAQENGIGINVFIDFKIATTGLKDKEKIVNAIHRMRVGKSTKDKLYLLSGYAEKTLPETPWN